MARKRFYLKFSVLLKSRATPNPHSGSAVRSIHSHLQLAKRIEYDFGNTYAW